MGGYAVMNAGKLVWSKNRNTGNWYCWNVDATTIYVIERHKDGWYGISRRNQGDVMLVGMGRRKYLHLAKAVADRHHHAAILRGSNEDNKAYIKRFPIPEEN